MGKTENGPENLIELFQRYTWRTLFTLLKYIAEETWDHVANTHVEIAVVKYEYVIGSFESTVQSVSENRKYIQGEGSYEKRAQHVFQTISFRSEKKLKNSFVLLRESESGAKGFWVCKMILLSRV